MAEDQTVVVTYTHEIQEGAVNGVLGKGRKAKKGFSQTAKPGEEDKAYSELKIRADLWEEEYREKWAKST